jgi:hypothetical protein
MNLLEWIQRKLFSAVLNRVATIILDTDPANAPQWMLDAMDEKALEIAEQIAPTD